MVGRTRSLRAGSAPLIPNCSGGSEIKTNPANVGTRQRFQRLTGFLRVPTFAGLVSISFSLEEIRHIETTQTIPRHRGHRPTVSSTLRSNFATEDGRGRSASSLESRQSRKARSLSASDCRAELTGQTGGLRIPKTRDSADSADSACRKVCCLEHQERRCSGGWSVLGIIFNEGSNFVVIPNRLQMRVATLNQKQNTQIQPGSKLKEPAKRSDSRAKVKMRATKRVRQT